ncbi:branched-chain amino acid ABC transporter permease [Actinospongicola halichondriae]|uniref:branched-chain amino acid ABC transporter permease n=1 Tax=Actinospongicola halichondriae TaxID=3236844 RepID=UPI003D55315A
MTATLQRLGDARRGLPAPVRAVLATVGLLAGWAVLDALLDRGAPPGILLRGAVIGSLYALGAIGIVLVYRGNGIVNFAQAELGSVAAVLAIEFVIQWDVNYFVAIAAGLVIAAAMGWTIDALVIRRFRKAPRLILTVATIGIAQILAGLAILIPLLFTGIAAGRFATPFSFTFAVDPITFDGNYLLVLVIVPLALFLLGTFLFRTDYGIAVRAAAENDDRANLLGVPVKRLSGLVWAIAALLSATAVMLRVPLLGFASFSGVSGGGNALLLRILAAAVIGRMEKLPTTVVAAVGIGVFEELASSEFSNTSIVDALLVGVILVALLVQRDAFARSVETGISSWKAVREVRPIPAELRRLPEVLWGTRLIGGLVFVAAVTVPVWARPSQEQAMSLLLIYGIVAVSLLVLTGWAGQISLGQFAFVGIGGAATGTLYGTHGWDYLLAVPVGIAVAAAVAVVVGLPALRVRGPFLAVTTLAFAVTTATVFLSDTYFGWFVPKGVEAPVLWKRIDLRVDWVQYEVCLVGLLLAIAVARNLRRSRIGRMLIAVRDNEPAASTLTIAPTVAKLTGFAISGALAGFAGSLYVVNQRGIFADAFGADVSIRLFSMVVIGGLGTISGALMGAGYVRGAEFFLPAQWSLIASGVGILLLLVVLPEGLGGGMFRLRDGVLRRIARRRGIHVPSLLEDRRIDDEAPDPTPPSDDGPEPERALVAAGEVAR